MEYECELRGKKYRFVFDDSDDPDEGATLVMVADAATGQRLVPSRDADPEAWDMANKHFGLPA